MGLEIMVENDYLDILEGFYLELDLLGLLEPSFFSIIFLILSTLKNAPWLLFTLA